MRGGGLRSDLLGREQASREAGRAARAVPRFAALDSLVGVEKLFVFVESKTIRHPGQIVANHSWR